MYTVYINVTDGGKEQMKHSYREYKHSTHTSNGVIATRKTVVLPQWCECFASIVKSSPEAASNLLQALSPEQYYALADQMAQQANVTQWHMVSILDGLKG
jgi:hypothetical protein